jgi:hypothetical protein
MLSVDPQQLYAFTKGKFHAGIQIVHGKQTCKSCHRPPRFEGFQLADGKPVSYQDVTLLCAQCHSRQSRDYQQGAHGGMTGYWDLDAGVRDRNHCIDCHNAHSPTFPRMLPAPHARDRFLEEGGEP